MKKFSFKKIIEFTLLALFVFGFRLLIEDIIPIFEENLNLNFGRFLVKLLSNYPLTLLTLLLDILIVYFVNKLFDIEKTFQKILLTLILSFTIAFSTAFWMRAKYWDGDTSDILFKDQYFVLTLFASFLFNFVIVLLLQVYSFYSQSNERKLNIEIGKKNKARYQYQQLKNQLNPHFLFNSLNVLDFLIHTDQERASKFVRKLSSVYRYLLSNEINSIVTLEEEVEFVKQYIDLLKERFVDGLIFNINVEDRYLYHSIIPGGLQLLVENATKHNIVSGENPLRIDIQTIDNCISVKNNIQPRITTIDSSGTGIKNIKGQYKLLFDEEISIFTDSNFFEVKIPLIK